MTPSPTNAELDILRIVWSLQEATVREVNEALNAESNKEVGYTTTLKFMQIMHEKGLLSRRKEGKTHIYLPAIDQKETQNSLLDRLIDSAFQGSAMRLVMQALGHRQTSQEELDAIRQLLDDIEKGNVADSSE